jgi:hypothetical protein
MTVSCAGFIAMSACCRSTRPCRIRASRSSPAVVNGSLLPDGKQRPGPGRRSSRTMSMKTPIPRLFSWRRKAGTGVQSCAWLFDCCGPRRAVGRSVEACRSWDDDPGIGHRQVAAFAGGRGRCVAQLLSQRHGLEQRCISRVRAQNVVRGIEDGFSEPAVAFGRGAFEPVEGAVVLAKTRAEDGEHGRLDVLTAPRGAATAARRTLLLGAAKSAPRGAAAAAGRTLLRLAPESPPHGHAPAAAGRTLLRLAPESPPHGDAPAATGRTLLRLAPESPPHGDAPAEAGRILPRGRPKAAPIRTRKGLRPSRRPRQGSLTLPPSHASPGRRLPKTNLVGGSQLLPRFSYAWSSPPVDTPCYLSPSPEAAVRRRIAARLRAARHRPHDLRRVCRRQSRPHRASCRLQMAQLLVPFRVVHGFTLKGELREYVAHRHP